MVSRRTRDLVDAALDGRQHPEPEQVDLQEAGVRARVLVPLDDLPLGHGRGLDGQMSRALGGDDHPARVLRDVARQAGRLPDEAREGLPARRRRPALPHGLGDLLLHVVEAPGVHGARRALHLRMRHSEGLAEVAHRRARLIGREGGDEEPSARAVALVHAR